MREERGQTAAELMGMLLVVAAIIGALAASNVGTAVANGVSDAICTIAGAGCEADRGDGGRPGETRAEALERRESALAPLAGRGEGYADLLAQAADARERGDLDEADRLLDLLEHYQQLAQNDRGDLVDDLAGPSAAEFEELVDQGTIDEDGGRNRRYFTVPPSPGDGLIVMDYFIPGDSSGPLRGDGRGTEDPLLGDPSLDDSRIVVVIDRESGRGVITQSETCLAGWVQVGYCESARPIELRDPLTRPQGNPLPGQAPNEFRVDGGDGTLEVEYDALNSVTPLAISVDGTVRFERGPDGDYRVVSDSRDPYPRIVTGQYRPGRPPRIIDETDDEPVLPGAFPGPVRDVIDGAGEVVDRACDIPVPPVILGPFAGPARDVVC